MDFVLTFFVFGFLLLAEYLNSCHIYFLNMSLRLSGNDDLVNIYLNV